MENNKLIYIDPVKRLGGLLLTVDKPARYVGGEVGRQAIHKKQETNNNENFIFRALIAFPDLYEIGMGNQALRIIYNYMNGIKGVSCDRAFAPAPDFEKLLRENNVPLYGLDTGISLAGVDLLMFTLGYELGLNGILTMLDVSGIPLRRENRNNDYPIIIAGGPAVSNPLPYSPFIDAFWIGEAEAGFFDLAGELAELKKTGEGREALLKKIISHPNVWAGNKEKATRAIYYGFSESKESPSLVYPVPSMKIIQNHGTVEIMRGCPNGCRFCHAGFWYRPARQKKPEVITSMINDLVKKGGWQQISLSSLSSGDYIGIDKLIEKLNEQFAGNHVSFQLPSLKVSSFALSLLEKISVTRKSGLTFAVETPRDAWQMAINKEVTRGSVISIIEEAKKRGWKGAKFYFMIGLRTETRDQTEYNEQDGEDSLKSEEEEIVSFVLDVSRRTKMRFNINTGIFIPKPHTPFQWSSQLDTETAIKKLNYIRSKLKPFGHKVSIPDPIISKIEGLLSRGDERAGWITEEAWREGSRLDAWDEFINRDTWLEILEKNYEYVNSVFTGKNHALPWSGISSCVTEEFLINEKEKSDISERTPSCREKCSLCGVCNKGLEKIPQDQGTAKNEEESPGTNQSEHEGVVNHVNNQVSEKTENKSDPVIFRVLFSFTKLGSAVFHGHLSLIEIFSMSFRRAGIPVKYTQGFNPLAKMEFASPLSTGISGENEIAIADFDKPVDTAILIKNLNANLPEGITIKKAEIFIIKSGEKKHSLSSLLWGFAYKTKYKTNYVNFKNEKVYRTELLENDCKSVFDMNRCEVLALNIINDTNEWVSFFDVYKFLYP